MGNWFKKLFCGSNCHCHGDKKECCHGDKKECCHGEKSECCSNTPKVVTPAEEKPVSESSTTPEVKM